MPPIIATTCWPTVIVPLFPFEVSRRGSQFARRWPSQPAVTGRPPGIVPDGSKCPGVQVPPRPPPVATTSSGEVGVVTISRVPTSSDPHGHHEWHSATYVDEWITSDTTRDEERVPVLRRMVELIPRAVDSNLRVLDVGAGYGLLSEQVLDCFPLAWLVCQDFSEPMFAHARSRLATEAHRVDFVISDLMDSSWTADLGDPFDAVVSAIAIHNVRYPERIRAIYEEIAGLLAPGGCFLNCDLLMPAPLDEQLEWLRAAGLERVACFSEEDQTAVFGGFAPADPPTN